MERFTYVPNGDVWETDRVEYDGLEGFITLRKVTAHPGSVYPVGYEVGVRASRLTDEAEWTPTPEA